MVLSTLTSAEQPAGVAVLEHVTLPAGDSGFFRCVDDARGDHSDTAALAAAARAPEWTSGPGRGGMREVERRAGRGLRRRPHVRELGGDQLAHALA